MGISKKILNDVKRSYGGKNGGKIAEKHRHISSHAAKFVEEHFNIDKSNIIIAGSQITDIVLNYFVDIQRFKERRGMNDDQNYISAGKIAAFTAKWIIRLRPICVEPIPDSNSSEKDIVFSKYVNEIFAVEHAEFIIKTKLNPKLYRELAFEFRQKKLSETQLYMTLEQASGFYATS